MKTPTFEKHLASRLGLKGNSAKEIMVKLFAKPFYATSPKAFWYHWNPFYSYILTYFIYRPARLGMPKSLAMLVTFFASGYILHDIFNMLFAIPRDGFYLPYPRVCILFLLFSITTIVFELLSIDFKKIKPQLRPLIHIAMLVLIFFASYKLNNFIFSLID